MKISNKIIVLALRTLAITITSCKVDDEGSGSSVTSKPTTYDVTVEPFSPGAYNGQTTRISLLTALKDIMQPTTITAITDDAIKEGIEFGSDGTDATTNLYEKIDENVTGAKGTESYAVADAFIAMADSLEKISISYDVDAADGTEGQLSLTTDKGRFVTSTGVELAQVIEKGLYGAIFYDQMVDDYLASARVADQVANDISDATYDTQGTQRQHDWDEAFGYLGAASDYPSTTGSFIAKYMNNVSADLAQTTMDAFINGRYELVLGEADGADNSDNDVIETAAATIEESLEKAFVGAAFGYLNASINDLDLGTDAGREAAIHHISEAFGFLYSLTFVESNITATEVYAVLEELGWSTDDLTGAYEANLWTITKEDIEDAIDLLDDNFSDLATVTF